MSKKLPEPSKIDPCGLTLKQQELYIQQLEKIVQYPSGIHERCPARSGTKPWGACLREFRDPAYPADFAILDPRICLFCRTNVGSEGGCPCQTFGKDEAIRRARNLIRRFEALVNRTSIRVKR